MRTLPFVLALAACGSSPPPAPVVASPPVAPPASALPPTVAQVETLAADTPKTTVAGNTFVAPAGWKLSVVGAGTLLEAPESGSRIGIFDFPGVEDADKAVELAWTAFATKAPFPFKRASDGVGSDGWSAPRQYAYDVPATAKRVVVAATMLANKTRTVIVVDLAEAVAEKRNGQLGVLFSKLLPKGGARETFAGKTAHELDKTRLAALTKFVEEMRVATSTPGIALGIVQNGKVVFAGGFGVRQLGKPAKVDGNTKFMIASNTKAMTTLMLAKLVDAKKLAWDQAATSALPSFKLGDAETTSKVQVKHLVCACTGLPRQDLEWILEYANWTPESAMQLLGTMQPTSKFGELFQYSNLMAAAGGYVGGHVAFPTLELGAAYDKAMQSLVFDPLGMKSATFDFKRGSSGNAAVPHSTGIDDKPALAIAAMNRSVLAARPAGAAWVNTQDMLRYVSMELAEGVLPNGKPYIGKPALLARRAPQVAVSNDSSYGMGLSVDKTWGITVINHGGDLFGFHSDMWWLPEHGVGLVVMVNGDQGASVRGFVERRLLELLFDGKPEAEEQFAASRKQHADAFAVERKLIAVPAELPGGGLASVYKSAALGEIKVSKKGAATWFDFGEFASEVASRKDADGTISLIPITSGALSIPLIAGSKDGKRTLTTRDAQHEYVFTEQ